MSTAQSMNVQTNLSSYEKLRLSNIIRNNAKLRELGLISELEEKRSNLLAQGIQKIHGENECKGKVSPGNPKKRKREAKTLREGSRKSLRLQKLDAEMKPLDETTRHEKARSVEEERIARVQECREVRLRAAKAIAEAGAGKASKENPTATYEHCLMRVKTMTSKKLETRVSNQ